MPSVVTRCRSPASDVMTCFYHDWSGSKLHVSHLPISHRLHLGSYVSCVVVSLVGRDNIEWIRGPAPFSGVMFLSFI